MNFSIDEKRAFKEVNEIINIMGEQYKSKIPKELLELLKKEEDKEYITKIDKNLSFEKQSISRIALILLNYINRNYWLEEDKKEEVKQLYRNNEEKYQNILREKYNPNEIFKKRGNK